MANWWEKPYRIIQTNLREIDARLDPRALIESVKAMHANVLLFNVGGIVAFYPTELEFHYRNPFLPGDLVGQVLEEAHRNGIRLIGRFDFSKATRPVFEEHPDWFWRTPQGQPVIYNGLYHTCINGGWYREYAGQILTEALSRYDLDGLFFNMFGYQVRDYSGNYHGVCQCPNCHRLFREMYGERLPLTENWDDPVFLKYVAFRKRTSRDVAAQIYAVAKRTRPTTGVMLRFDDSDLIRMEVNRAVDRPLPEWGHWAGEQAKWAASFGKGKPYSSAIVHFIDIPYRFVGETGACQALRLSQQLANGAQLDYYVLGTLDQEDTKPYAAVREIFAYHEANETLYTGLRSGAKVALFHSEKSGDFSGGKESLARPGAAFRGMYRILSESHMPFDIVSDLRMGDPDIAETLRRYATILLPNAACLSRTECEALDAYVQQGGNLIATFATGLYDEHGARADRFRLACLGAEKLEAVRTDVRSAYLRIMPGELDLPDTRLMVLDQAYLYVTPREGAETLLRFVPPQRYGPPEKCYPDLESTRPGVLLYRYGRGRTAYLPWQPDALYYRHSLEEYRALIAELVDRFAPRPPVLLQAPRQLEVSIHRQPAHGRTVVHVVNFSGHQGTAYHEPVAAHGVRVGVRCEPGEQAGRVWEAVTGTTLGPMIDSGYVWAELPPVRHFAAVVFEGLIG